MASPSAATLSRVVEWRCLACRPRGAEERQPASRSGQAERGGNAMLLENPSALHDQYARALFDDVMPFWLRHSLDPEHGGYRTCLRRDGSVYEDTKNVW